MSTTPDHICQYDDGNLIKAELELVTSLSGGTDSQVPTAAAVNAAVNAAIVGDLPELLLSSYASLADAIASIGASDVQLVIDTPTVLTAHTTIPANIRLRLVYKNIFSGAYTLTLEEPIEAGSFQVFDLATSVVFEKAPPGGILPEWFGAVGGVTADTDAIKAAIAATPAGAKLRFHPGVTYVIEEQIAISKSIVIDLNGATIDATSGTYTLAAFSAVGSVSALPNLNADVTRLDSSLDFVIAHGLSADDLLFIFNPIDSSFSGFRTYYREGEILEVLSTPTTTTVDLKGYALAPHTAANVDLYKLSPVEVEIRNGEIRSDVATYAIHFDYCHRSLLSNLKVKCAAGAASGINIQRSRKVSVENCEVNQRTISGASNYGLSIISSQDIDINGGFFYGTRHCIAMGSVDEVNGIPVRGVLVSGIVGRNDPDSGVHSFDMHGNADGVCLSNSTIYGGVIWAGKNIYYRGVDVIGSSFVNRGVGVLSAEILGGRFEFTDGSIDVTQEPAGRGIIDVGGNSNVLTSDTAEDCTFVVRGGRIKNPSATTSTNIMRVGNNGNTNKVNIRLEDLELDVPNLSRVLRMDALSGSYDADFIIVDRLASHGLNGVPLALLGGTFVDAPMRMQAQSGSEDIVVASGVNSQAGTAVTFNWAYPKTPHIIPARNAANRDGYMGIPWANNPTNAGFSPVISTDDGGVFSAGTTITYQWQTGIWEV